MGGSYKWPPMSKVVEYRRAVRNLILKVIEDTPLELPVTMESPWVCFSVATVCHFIRETVKQHYMNT